MKNIIQSPRQLSSCGRVLFGGKFYYEETKNKICTSVVSTKNGIEQALKDIENHEANFKIIDQKIMVIK